MYVTITAWLTNWDQYREGTRRSVQVQFPTSREEMRKALKAIGVDGIRYQQAILTEFDSNLSGFHHCLTRCDAVDEVNYLARLLSELSDSELETFQAVVEYGEHSLGAADLIDLALNLDHYELHPGVGTDEELGRIYVDDLEMLDVPENLRNYFDYEAYGRDVRLNENGCFVKGGYLTRNPNGFVERYGSLEDIPPEYRVFAYPKLTIREKLTAYKEVTEQAARERPAPEQGHDDR